MTPNPLLARLPRPLALALSSVLLVLGVVALGRASTGQTTAAADSERTPLERALAAVDAGRIGIDLDFIASDALAGRDSPSPGLRIAARYIRARLQRLGISPGAPEESYFYEYELVASPLDVEGCRLEVNGSGRSLSFSAGRDYFFGSGNAGYELDRKAEAVWCGLGRREDYVPDARGKWAVCLDVGQPTDALVRTAYAASVAGLIVIPSADYSGDPYPQRFAGQLATARMGRVSYPGSAVNTNRVSRLYLTRERGLELLGLSAALPAGVEPADWTPEVGQDLGLDVNELRRLVADGGRVTMENVCGFWPGSHPVKSKEVVIVSAHYDHVGTDGDDIFNGADDNGTGTCGLMALAEALTAHGPLERSILLIWVSAEEKGLLGSRAWSDNPWLPEGCRPVANINIDMIGRNAADQLLYTPTEELAQYYNDLAQVTEKLAPLEGFTDLGSADAYYFRSDQANFERLGIPVMFLFTDIHGDYHQPTDTPDKIDTDKVRRVVRTVVRMLVELDDKDLRR
ncbi:MAG: M28 family peptidase [Planctomycetota bacterium]